MIERIPAQDIRSCIYRIRGQQVMLDSELAYLYDVPTKRRNEQVRRNLRRFPPDFMFQLSAQELESLRSNSATLKKGGRGAHRKYRPYVFTEQGVSMVSGVLSSDRAIAVNIAIMRAFVRLRHALAHDRDLIRRVEKVEGKIGLMETDIRFMLQDIRDIKKPLEIPPKPQPNVKGFRKN